jgi:N-acetylglucosaminyldiphosphoundecaprenol N-acetyl-beta-D-mannosaminyltransferase
MKAGTSPLITPVATPPAVATEPVLGVPLAITDYERTLDWIDATAASAEKGYVCVAAVHTVMACQEDAELRDAVLAADFTVPDGQPLVWALNALGHELPDRVYGPELMSRYCARCAELGHRVWLCGGHDAGALAQLERSLQLRYPGIAIAGTESPPHRPHTAAEDDRLASRINADGPDVVFVGLGAPRQEKWMARMRSKLDAPVLMGVGAAFDFLAGTKRQAPAWMQRTGLEWLFRLSQEPLRLFPRYARHNPAFVAAFARQYLRERRRPPVAPAN